MTSKNFIFISKNPKTYLSGPTIFTGLFISYLLRKGHKVILISPTSVGNNENEYFRIDENKNFFKIEVELPQFPKVPMEYCSFLIKDSILAAIDIFKQVDFVASVYTFPSIIDIDDLKKEFKFKTIAFMRGSDIIHGLNPNSYYNMLYPYFPYLRKRFLKSLNNSDFRSSVSHWLSNYSNKFGVNKMHHITYPVIYSKGLQNLDYGKTSEKLREYLCEKIKKNNEGFEFEKDDIILSYAGRFHPDKNIDLLIEIVKEYINRKYKYYSKIKLILAGGGFLKGKIKGLIDEYRLGDTIYMTVLSYEDVYKLARISYIGFNLSYPNENNHYFFEAAGSNVAIYSGMGIPVIYVDDKKDTICGTSELLSKNNSTYLFIQKNNFSTMAINGAKKIEYLLKNKKIYRNISKENSNKARRFYDNNLLPDLENRILSTFRR